MNGDKIIIEEEGDRNQGENRTGGLGNRAGSGMGRECGNAHRARRMNENM